MRILLAIALLALAGCERSRYEGVLRSGEIPLVEDRTTGKLYIVRVNGAFLQEVQQ